MTCACPRMLCLRNSIAPSTSIHRLKRKQSRFLKYHTHITHIEPTPYRMDWKQRQHPTANMYIHPIFVNSRVHQATQPPARSFLFLFLFLLSFSPSVFMLWSTETVCVYPDAGTTRLIRASAYQCTFTFFFLFFFFFSSISIMWLISWQTLSIARARTK